MYAQLGSNELIVASFDGGAVAAADTINFTVTGTGINLKPSSLFNLAAVPNPFVSTASISFQQYTPGITSVRIFDLTGRSLVTLIQGELASGNHSVHWDGCTDREEPASAGLYLCRIESEGVTETTGLCLLR